MAGEESVRSLKKAINYVLGNVVMIVMIPMASVAVVSGQEGLKRPWGGVITGSSDSLRHLHTTS